MLILPNEVRDVNSGSELDPWFAIQVAPKAERAVELRLSYKGYQTFVPVYRVLRKWSDRQKQVLKPLFPGYVFCRTALEVFGKICCTQGVIRIISSCGRPQPICDSELAWFLRLNRSNIGREPCDYYATGDRVEVIEGALSGLVGIVKWIKGRNRIVVSVNLIMKSVAVDLPTCSLMLLPATESKPIKCNKQNPVGA